MTRNSRSIGLLLLGAILGASLVVGCVTCSALTVTAASPWLFPQPTMAPTATPLATPIDETVARHLRIFSELWQAVHDWYLYPDYNGADWDSIGEEYREIVLSGLSDEDFWLLMDGMLLELNDDHSIFLSPAEAQEEDAAYVGEADYVGIGITATPVPERGYAVVLMVIPDSPAAEAGLQPHDHILAVDGFAACCDEYGYDSLWLLYGREGTTVEMEVRTPGQESRLLTVTRSRVRGNLPVETRRLKGDVGYILIPTFWDESIPDQVEQALRDFSAEEKLEGLIIDNRLNGGGGEEVTIGVLALFTDGYVGSYANRWDEQPLHVKGKDVAGSQQVPLVILIGEETVSYAEIFSGILGESGRARLVGTTTMGNVEALYGYDFEDGSRAWIAEETFRPPSGTNWEKTGIVPHLEVPAEWDQFTTENDPQVNAALRWLTDE